MSSTDPRPADWTDAEEAAWRDLVAEVDFEAWWQSLRSGACDFIRRATQYGHRAAGRALRRAYGAYAPDSALRDTRRDAWRAGEAWCSIHHKQWPADWDFCPDCQEDEARAVIDLVTYRWTGGGDRDGGGGE